MERIVAVVCIVVLGILVLRKEKRSPPSLKAALKADTPSPWAVCMNSCRDQELAKDKYRAEFDIDANCDQNLCQNLPGRVYLP